MLLAIDQGTTGTTCLVVDGDLRPIGRGYLEIGQHFPQPGWVEHDPEEIWSSVLATAEAACVDAGVAASDLTGVGITNQRETTVVWERRTGRAVQNAIVWQDRRTAERCSALPAELVREKTGLVCDPYFSASKLEWILAHNDLAHGDLAFGTIDAWLTWKLTGGRVHATDVTNASRTMLFNLTTSDWDDELLALFSIDRALLPTVVPSAGVVAEVEILGALLPLGGIAGDQQAALFGQGCVAPGQVKATYGTGTFVLANVGDLPGRVADGLLATAAAVAPGVAPQFAAEGSVLVGGSSLQWLRDGLGLIESAADTERIAAEVDSTDGVFFVPALTGLGSPHWDADARGLICGLTRGTTPAHLVRAALEGIAHQVADIVDVLPVEAGVLRADGGATANRFLMQFQADLIGSPVEVSADADATALGAAALAGLAVGFWPDVEHLGRLMRCGARYEPTMTIDERARRRGEWAVALDRARSAR